MVKRRAPAHDVDDVVQAALVDAVTSRDQRGSGSVSP
jgi:DNA-directed RNA polymerase specialized sigma24 family protein